MDNMINEQNNFRTVEEIEDTGFSLDRPSDYTSEKYDLIEVEDFYVSSERSRK